MIFYYIDGAINSFPAQCNMMYSKSHFINRNMIYYVFKFLWCRIMFKRITKLTVLQRVSVAYQKAVKNTAGLDV